MDYDDNNSINNKRKSESWNHPDNSSPKRKKITLTNVDQYYYENGFQKYVLLNYDELYYPFSPDISLAMNPNITFKFVKQNIKTIGYIWDWFRLSAHENFTFEQIMSTIRSIDSKGKCEWDEYYRWDWWGISRNRNVTFQFILQHPEFPWEWSNGVSFNPNVTLQDVINHPDKPWNFEGISRNKSITFQDYLTTHDQFKWNVNCVLRCPKIQFHHIVYLLNNKDKYKVNCSYIWYYVNENPNIKFLNIARYFIDNNDVKYRDIFSTTLASTLAVTNAKIDTIKIGNNESISIPFNIELIDRSHAEKFNSYQLQNKMTWSELLTIIDNPKFELSWHAISSNPNIELQQILSTLQDPRFKWNPVGISNNPGFTPSLLLSVKDQLKKIGWISPNFSDNPNLTDEFIDKYSNKLTSRITRNWLEYDLKRQAKIKQFLQPFISSGDVQQLIIDYYIKRFVGL